MTTAGNSGIASVVEADVDVSAIDWTNVQEGELTAVGTIDPGAVPGGTVTQARPVE